VARSGWAAATGVDQNSPLKRVRTFLAQLDPITGYIEDDD
jgi:hypothetical protein